jgi:uncharacterized membrane protein
MQTVYCAISKKSVPVDEAYNASELRPQLFDLIHREHPEFSEESFIAIEVLNRYRKKYVTNIIEQEIGEVDQLEKEVIDAISSNKILSENIEDNIHDTLSVGQKVADHIAAFGGSWTFILSFFGFLLLWIVMNVWVLMKHAFDPFPFILLNLILSCIAAIQAPIIMMSQNRLEQKDRQRSEHDYKINLKAEIEIKLLHEKIDHLIVHQNKRLLEIQQIQADYLEDILVQLKGSSAQGN